MEEVINNYIREEIKKYNISDNVTKHLVYKNKRGTYQALNESIEIEKIVTDKVLEFIKSWLLNELFDGNIKNSLNKEIKNSILMELSSLGYSMTFKKN